MACNPGGNDAADNNTYYQAIVGVVAFQTTGVEAGAQSKMTDGGTASKLKTYAPTNTTLVTTVVTVRKNGAGQALTVSYTSGQTGQKEDLSHSFTFVATDLLAHEVAVPNDASGAKVINFRV